MNTTPTLIRTPELRRATLIALFAAIVSGVMATQAIASGPALKLFPTTVLEDIRETGEVAEAMENNLTDIIARLDLQRELYTQSLCEQSDDDPGCEGIARQLGATYLELLETMNDGLPEMERAVNNTKDSLEKRIRQELGQRSTPNSLQDMLLGKVAQPADSESLALRGRSGIRLSDRFKQYYRLVSTSSASNAQSLAVVASDIFLDMEEASTLIAATREEIGRATLMEQLNQSFGTITPEMEQVVGGVKSILFGDAPETAIIAAPPVAAGDVPYVSPLEL